MVVDLYSQNQVVYNLFYNIDVKTGEQITLMMDKPEEMDSVFADQDKVLDLDHQGTDINIAVKMVGKSRVRIMKDQGPGEQPKVIREFLINAVDSIQRPAKTLNATFSPAIPKVGHTL